MRKKIVGMAYFILLLSLVWGLTACGGATPTPAPPAEEPAAESGTGDDEPDA